MSENSARRFFIVLVLSYSVLHLGLSVFFYNPFTRPMVSGDLLRALGESWRIQYAWNEFQREAGDMVFHPLFYYAILTPFTKLEPKVAVAFFYFIQFLILPAAILLLTNSLEGEKRGKAGVPPKILFGLVLAVNFHPFLVTLSEHKVEGLEFFLICFAIWALKRERGFLSGVLVGLAENLKYYPAVLIGYFLLRGYKRALCGVLVAELVIGMMLLFFYSGDTLWALGVQHPAHLVFGGQLQSNRLGANLEWQSLSGAVVRWFTSPKAGQSFAELVEIGAGGVLKSPELAKGISLILKIAFGGVYLALLLGRARVKEHAQEWTLRLLEVALTLSAIPIFIQAVRVGYLILVLPAFIIVGHILFQSRYSFRWPEKLLFVLSYFLAGIILPGGLLNLFPPHPLWGSAHYFAYLWFSLPFYGYLGLIVCIVLCFRRLGVVSRRWGIAHESFGR